MLFCEREGEDMDFEIKAYSNITKEYLLEVRSNEAKFLIDMGFKSDSLDRDDCQRLHEILENDSDHDAIFFASGDFRYNEISKCIQNKMPRFFAKTKKTKMDKKKQPTRYYFNSGEKIVIGDLSITPLVDKKSPNGKCVFVINYESDDPIIISETEIRQYVRKNNYLFNLQTI